MPSAWTSPVSREGEAERDDDEPPSQLHRQIGGTNQLGILAGQTRNGESEKARDRAEPSHG